MVPAIGPRWRTLLAGITTLGVLLATTLVSAQTTHRGERPSPPIVDEPAVLDNGVWFEQFLVAQSESANDRTVAQIRPLVPPAAPITPQAAPTVDDRQPPRLTPQDPAPEDLAPPDLAPPDLAAPDLAAPDLAAPDLAPTDNTRFTLFRRSRSRASFARQRRPIAVLGDSLVDAGQLELEFTVQDYSVWPSTPATATASTDIPLIATATRRRISKNNSVLPTDRLIFSYQHFQNALEADISHPAVGDSRHVQDLDRTTIGIEKTFFDGRWSIDLRLPVLSRYDVAVPNFALTNDRLGNASFVIKRLCYEADGILFGAGLGIDLPTGSDGQVLLPNSEITIANDAYHALPYLGFQISPSDNTVVQAFAQLDIPLNDNEVEVRTPSAGSFFGQFDEQGLLFLSLAGAHWVYENPDAARLRGLAALLEFHYTTMVDDSNQLTITAAGDTYDLRNPVNRVDYLNMAVGMQARVGTTDFRVAAVLPLLNGENQVFDAEVMFQINRGY